MVNSLLSVGDIEEQKAGEMKGVARKLIYAVGLMLAACTSAKENSEFNAAVPATIQSDADRRAIYNSGTRGNRASNSNPIPAPGRLDNRASDVNRQKNIEDRGVNGAPNKPLEVRTRELNRPVIADTIR